MRDNDSPQLPISQALGKDASLNIPPGLSSSIHFIQSRELIYLFVLSIFQYVARVSLLPSQLSGPFNYLFPVQTTIGCYRFS